MKVTETFILVAFFAVTVIAKEPPKLAEDFTAHVSDDTLLHYNRYHIIVGYNIYDTDHYNYYHYS